MNRCGFVFVGGMWHEYQRGSQVLLFITAQVVVFSHRPGKDSKLPPCDIYCDDRE